MGQLSKSLLSIPQPSPAKVAKEKEIKMREMKRAKVKKGWLAVAVGREDVHGGCQRFMIPISYLYNPQFRRLLEEAQEVYGYGSSGPLKLPCSVDDFLHLRWLIEREASGSDDHHPSPSSLHTC